jgi:hypothetical protein
LSRLYHPTPDELQGAKPLWEGGWGSDDNRGSWFYNYQDLLVRLANTDYGRDLLRIDKLPYPVIAVRKNMIQFDMSRDLGPGYACADVRSGARWGDIIRFRWLAVKQALDRMNLEVLLAMPKYIMHKGRRAPGITKFGFRVDTDATGSGPTWTSQYRSHLGMAAADTDLGDDKRIKLVVVYTLAVTPKVIMF